MNKIIFISGIVASISILVMRITLYYDGLAFSAAFPRPLAMFPIGAISLLTFFSFSIGEVVSTIRKTSKIINIYLILIISCLLIISFSVKLPTHLDGMHQAIINNLQKDELDDFIKNIRKFDAEKDREINRSTFIERLMNTNPAPMNLIDHPPRIEVSKTYVALYYGSGLTKHRGYLISETDNFPKKHIPEGMYKQVYDKVWVYQDTW